MGPSAGVATSPANLLLSAGLLIYLPRKLYSESIRDNRYANAIRVDVIGVIGGKKYSQVV